MNGPHYHPSLTDGSLDRPRDADHSKLRKGVADIEQRDPPDAGQVLFEADRTMKGEGPERLQISVKEYSGHKYLDLRIWWKNDRGMWLPSKRGVTIRSKELADVVCVLGDAARLMGGS